MRALTKRGVQVSQAVKRNVDYPATRTYHLMGFNTPTFTPVFLVSRIPGWTAHIVEQAASDSLILPLSQYNGCSNARPSLTGSFYCPKIQRWGAG